MSLNNYHWRFFRGNEVKDEYLKRICMFRSEVLHDGGFRHAFGAGGRMHGDFSSNDYHAIHVVAEVDDRICGTVRIATPECTTVAESVLGREQFLSLLDHINADPLRVIEINRLMVDRTHRKLGLGRHLMHAAIAIIDFEYDRNNYTIIGSAGNCSKQTDFFLNHTDYQTISGIKNVFAKDFNDEITFLIYGREPYTKSKKGKVFFENYFAFNTQKNISF